MPKTRAYGSDVQLLGGFEDSYGSGTSAKYWNLSFGSSDLGSSKALGYDPLLGQGRQAKDPYYEGEKVEGNIEPPFMTEETGFWLKGIFGTPTTTDNGDGSYTHVFVPSNSTLPSLVFEEGHIGLSSPVFKRRMGVKLGGLSFSMARSGNAKMSISAMGQSEELYSAAISSSPSKYENNRFSNSKGAVKKGEDYFANVVGGSFSFSNSLEAVETIRDDGKIEGVDESEANATGSVEVLMSTDTSLELAGSNETPISLEYSFSRDDGSSIKFEMPRVFVEKSKQPVSGPGGIKSTYNWRASSEHDDGYVVKVTLTNTTASY